MHDTQAATGAAVAARAPRTTVGVWLAGVLHAAIVDRSLERAEEITGPGRDEGLRTAIRFAGRVSQCR